MNHKIFHRAAEFYDDIKELREEGVSKGMDIGFYGLKDLYSVKLGSTTYLYSSPYSGKSMLVWELAVDLAVKYGWVTAVYSPETGTKEEIVAELVFKMTGKELYKSHKNSIDDDTLKQVLSFINDHFIFIDPDVKDIPSDKLEECLLTVFEFYKAVDSAENYYGKKIHLTVADPFNEFAHDFKADEGRQDLYIERVLGLVRRDAKRNERHNIIITHVTDQPSILKDGIRFYEPALPRQIAGGQAWYRRGMMMVSIWRPPYGLKDFDGRPFEENELHVIVQKAKPRYCGKKGTAILFYDMEIGRYYEVIEGKRYYAFQYDKYLKDNKKIQI